MKYIVYTTAGYTELPNGAEKDNCQIIDFLEDTQEAEADIKARYAKELDIRYDQIILHPFIDKKTINAIRDVISYMWEDEERNYEECQTDDYRENKSILESSHIFTKLKIISDTFGK